MENFKEIIGMLKNIKPFGTTRRRRENLTTNFSTGQKNLENCRLLTATKENDKDAEEKIDI